MRLQEDSRRKLTQLSQPATAYFDCVRQRQHCCTPSTAASKYQRLPSNNTSGRVADPAWADPALADPAWADPTLADPAWADPALADPAWADPAWADPAWADPAWAGPTCE